MKVILLVLITFSLGYADFTRSNDMVTDNKTGLVWQDDVSGATSWQGAINHCEALTLGGESDWRLPNVSELDSIIDRVSPVDPRINNIFVNIASGMYWTSTTNAQYPDFAWYAHFTPGNLFNNGSKEYDSKYVRCVRAGQ